MLNRNQKKFKREMEKIGKEAAKEKKEKVYSYIEDRYISGNYPVTTNQISHPLFKVFRGVFYVVLSVFSLLSILIFSFGGHSFFALSFVLLFLSLILTLFGLISPRLVFRRVNRKRGRVLAVYGSASLLFLILSLVNVPNTNKIAAVNGNKSVVANTGQEDAQQYKKEAKQIRYIDLARNPDHFQNQRVLFTGKVIQTIELGNDVSLRVNVDKGDYGIWDDTIFVNYQRANGESRILENDVITLWGTIKGLKTYTSVLGTEVTIPEIDAKYIVINGNEK